MNRDGAQLEARTAMLFSGGGWPCEPANDAVTEIGGHAVLAFGARPVVGTRLARVALDCLVVPHPLRRAAVGAEGKRVSEGLTTTAAFVVRWRLRRAGGEATLDAERERRWTKLAAPTLPLVGHLRWWRVLARCARE